MNNKITNLYNLDYNKKKAKFLSLQLIANIGFIIALFISYLLTYDKKSSLENKKRLFTDKESQGLALFQTILVFFISIAFLYINYEQYGLSKKSKDGDEKDLFLQIETSILAIISAIIGLYIVFKNYNKSSLQIAETELF